MPSISEVWPRICAQQNEQFKTITGKPFTYTVSDNALVTTLSPTFPLHIGGFEKALARVPLKGPGEITNEVRGAAYIWAILHDARIRRSDW